MYCFKAKIKIKSNSKLIPKFINMELGKEPNYQNLIKKYADSNRDYLSYIGYLFLEPEDAHILATMYSMDNHNWAMVTGYYFWEKQLTVSYYTDKNDDYERLFQTLIQDVPDIERIRVEPDVTPKIITRK